jgi:2-methylaconitate cis-trans-isomerase PrpF
MSDSIPKIAFIAAARDYRTLSGSVVTGKSVNMLARVMAMGKMHKAVAITAGIPAAIAAVIPESVVNRVVAKGKPVPQDGEIVIGHPWGMMDVKVDAATENGQPRIVSCTIGRTARKIMDGKVYIPRTVYEPGA